MSLSQAEAQQQTEVRWSVGTEPPKTKRTGERDRLPLPHLRRELSHRALCHAEAAAGLGAGLPGLAAPHRHDPLRGDPAFHLWHRQLALSRPAAATRRQGSRSHGGRGEPVGDRSGTAPDARRGRARHPLQSVAAGRHHAGHDRAAGEADRADGLALPDQRAGGSDRRGAGDLPACAGTAGVRPSGACAGCGQSELPVGPTPDRQGQHVGEAVRRLWRQQVGAARVCRSRRGRAGLRPRRTGARGVGQRLAASERSGRTRSRTMRCCSICWRSGCRTRRRGIGSWSRTRPSCTIFRAAEDPRRNTNHTLGPQSRQSFPRKREPSLGSRLRGDDNRGLARDRLSSCRRSSSPSPRPVRPADRTA